ncbi:MAG: hypothetical protein A2X36_17050 [Elusimicrobia bacterium GWA2_69_24]|nr:MAG: hypothetical protein A2X36_17050 [Elusimicrobia bacterium GWA2_69_24]HBL16249.1 hypothetical protein [Elusimicrobiota bacterium]
MICPRCGDVALAASQAQPGLEIDACPGCHGIWLDRSEIYCFVSRPQQAFDEMNAAYQVSVPSALACPRCRQSMAECRLGEPALAFDACPHCGGTWFDPGEVQAFYGVLEDQWRKSTGAPPQPRIGPRRPTAEELEAWLGPDRSPAQAAAGALALAGLTMLLHEPARSPAAGAALLAAFFPLAFLAVRVRRWYIGGAFVIMGEIGSYAAENVAEITARILFTYEEWPYQVTRVIRTGGPLDRGARALLRVLVHPSWVRGAFILPPEGADAPAGPWSEADRDVRIVPKSLFFWADPIAVFAQAASERWARSAARHSRRRR